MSDFKKIGIGQECRKCKIPTIAFKRLKFGDKLLKQPYYFTLYDECPKCHSRYMIEASKVYPEFLDENFERS